MKQLAGASAYALGHVAVHMLETDGTLSAVPLLEARRQYANAFDEGTRAGARLQEDGMVRAQRSDV